MDEIQAEYSAENGEQRDQNATAFLSSLTNFESERSYDIRVPVKQFWEENEQKYTIIHPLAQVIHSVGANQCITERSFSGFSYIRSARRMSMDPKNLSNLLMVRLNKDIFYEFRKQEIDDIMKS